ncbi:exonuclease SbcCD subunit D [Thermodesulfobacteriota bacterium]
MPSFSFVHTADLHLGSPFSTLGINNPELASVMRSATFEAFERVVDLCLDNKVDFLLVAGDVFDGADRSIRAQITFLNGLKKLGEAGIESFVVHGNHDSLDLWSKTLEWPRGVHVFGDKVETVPVNRDGVLVAQVQGISYPQRDERRNLARLFSKNSPGFHLGLLHANVGSDTGHEPYAPCTLEDLITSGMDYWALGHVHSRRILSDGVPTVLYPGNTQGRNIQETGERGCYLVKVEDDHHVGFEFHATDVVRWAMEEVSINSLETEQDLLKTLEDRCRRISEEQSGRSVIVRIVLSGHGPLYSLLSNPNTLEELLEMIRESGMSRSPFVWVEQIRSTVHPEVDRDERIGGGDFLGELLRCAKELQGDGPEEFLKKELGPLFMDAKARGFVTLPGDSRAKALLLRAEDMCVAGLYDEDSE